MNNSKVFGRYICFIFLLLVVFLPNITFGVEPVRLFSSGKYLLNPHMEILEDQTNLLTINDIVQPGVIEKFVVSEGDITNFGITPSTYWLRFRLSYEHLQEDPDIVNTWYLEVNRSVLDVAELYIFADNGDFDTMKSDLRMGFSERDISYVTSVFPINMQSGDDTEYYVKIKNSSILVFSLILWEPREFLINVATDELFYGIYFGILLCLLIYNFFVWLSVKEISYLYYVGYLCTLTWFQVIEVGHGVIQSGWIFEIIGKMFLTSSIWITTGFIIQFFRHFLVTYEKYPISDFFLKILLWIVFISLLVTPFVSKIEALFWVSVFSVVFLSTLLAMSLYFLQRGDENSRFFFFAWVFNVTGFAVYSMMANGVLPANIVTLHAGEIGVLFESSLLAFALAERIKRSRASVLLSNQRAMDTSLQYKSIFRNSLEGKYEMDLYGVVKEINPAAAKIMGFSSVSGFMENKVLAAQNMFSIDQFCTLVHSGNHRDELYFESNYGGTCVGRRWALHKAYLVLDDKGEATSIEGSIFDITDEKERILAIENEENERVEKQIALYKSLQKSVLLSVMSSYIRMPLTSIVGFSEELKSENIQNHDKKYCTDIIVENSRILLRLINDILDYSKIEAGKFDIEKIPVNILRIIEDIHLDYKEKAESKNLSFDVVYNYPFPKIIIGDSTRIKQVLTNLCDNSLKFTKRGAISLSIGFIDGSMVFTVVDTGCGVTKEDLEKIFDEHLLVSKGKFGLVISKKLAILMGGDLNVTSKSGKGSVFELTIPVDGVEEWVSDERNRKEIMDRRYKKPSIVPCLQGQILLAEDNVVNQKLISKVLEKTGLTVTVVADGVQACDFCDSTLPDFILMDINMPLRDGLEATRYLRDKGYKLPIYALTAETDEVEIRKALDAGCDGFLQKPLDKPRLYEALIQCFDKKD